MNKFKQGQHINCRTQEEQDMVLDLFTMLGYTWNAGQQPRSYRCIDTPMSFRINSRDRFTQGSILICPDTIEAANLRNMYISLKVKLDI